MYSGDSAVPTTVSFCFLPLMIADSLSPETSSWASAKRSLTITSSARRGSTQRPVRSTRSFNTGRPLSGRDCMWPVIGSATPSTSSSTPTEMRDSAALTPSMARILFMMCSGARLAAANTSAKR